MRARDYHMWWKASHIGLGHPLEADNYAEIVEKLSPAGVAVVIAIHMLPHESSCEKDYQLSDEQADRMERLSAALRQIGGERLAAFVASSVGVDHIGQASSSISPEEQMQLMSQGMNIFDAWKAAARSYFEKIDIETHSELEALADQFAEARADELSADMARFGDQRPATKAGQRSFDDDWMEAVDEKHDRLHEEERAAAMEPRAERWDRDRRRAEKQLAMAGTAEDVATELVGRLSEAHRELAHFEAERLGPVAREFRSKLAILIDRHRELFPDDVRPDAAELRHAQVLAQVESQFETADAAWLGGLGRFASVQSEMYDPVVFAVEGDVDENQRTVYVGFLQLPGVNWGWAVPNVSLMLGPVGAPAALSEEVRSAVTDIIQQSDDLGRRLAMVLLSDFRERFLPTLSIGLLKIYKPDVTDDDVLDDVESASITIQWNPLIHSVPRVVYYFGVEWDSEHGICLEESGDGTFEFSEP